MVIRFPLSISHLLQDFCRCFLFFFLQPNCVCFFFRQRCKHLLRKKPRSVTGGSFTWTERYTYSTSHHPTPHQATTHLWSLIPSPAEFLSWRWGSLGWFWLYGLPCKCRSAKLYKNPVSDLFSSDMPLIHRKIASLENSPRNWLGVEVRMSSHPN